MNQHPSLPGRLATDLSVGDQSWPLAKSEVGFANGYLSLTVDTIVSPDGGEHSRVVVHPHRAVGVLAIDEQQRVLLVEQYRHPMGKSMLEIPAGIMDVAGESARTTAERELLEEADLRAASWTQLLTIAPTVGYSTETITLFAATELTAVPEDERIIREAEEADLVSWWVDLALAVEAVFAGRITDAKTVVAILAAAHS